MRIVMLALCLLGPATAWAKWSFLTEIGNEMSFLFVDPLSIRKDGDIRQASELVDLKMRGGSGEASVVSLVLYDCKEQRFRTLSVSTYSGPRATGQVVGTSTRPDEWVYPPSGSLAGGILKGLCSRKGETVVRGEKASQEGNQPQGSMNETKVGSANQGSENRRPRGGIPHLSDYGTDVQSMHRYILDVQAIPIETCQKALNRKTPDVAYCLYEHAPKDQRLAMLREAARLGHPMAQNDFAIYLDARNAVGDSAEIARLIRESAQSGVPAAQVTLGWWSMTGEHGIRIDYAEAMNWNMKGYEQGHSEGAKNIGELYAKGLGVPKDLGVAINWYKKVSLSGDDAVMARLSWLERQWDEVQTCEQKRGTSITSPFGQHYCLLPSKDGGKPCRDQAECEFRCLPIPEHQPREALGGQPRGVCSKDNYPFGCQSGVVDNRIVPGPCRD